MLSFVSMMMKFKNLLFLFALSSVAVQAEITFKFHRNLSSKSHEMASGLHSILSSVSEEFQNSINIKLVFKKKRNQSLSYKMGSDFLWNRHPVILINENYISEISNATKIGRQLFLFSLGEALDQEREFSQKRAFREITYWKSEGFFGPNQNTRENTNHSPRAEAVINETVSPRKSFASNLYLFLEDQEFKCRRPVHYYYFKSVFGVETNSDFDCAHTNQIFRAADPARNLKYDLVPLDPNRISEIDFVWGSPGKGLHAKFGHAMFRFVICREGRPVGYDCRADEDQHLMINFAANIADLEFDPIKGLRGKYPSMLLAENFATARDRYVQRQFQSLYSVPLVLTREQIKLFAERVVELHWAYQGDYKFFSNNCATEALSIVKTVLSERDDVQRLHVVRPKSIIRKLKGVGVLDTSYLKDLEIAKRRGYYFPSKKSEHEEKLNRIQVLLPVDSEYKEISIDNYINQTTPVQRKEIFDIVKGHEDFDMSIGLDFAELEENIRLRVLHKSWLSHVTYSVERNERNETQELSEIGNLTQVMVGLMTASVFLENGSDSYGIPAISEIDYDLNNSEAVEFERQVEAGHDQLRASHYRLYEEMLQEEEAIEANLQYFLSS